MSDERLEQLIAKWDAGDVSPEEEAELERLLDGDADARQTFARHFVEEAELYGVLREAAGYKQGQKASVPAFARDWRPRWLRSPGQAMVAAFLIMAMGGILFLSFAPAPQEVLVNDREIPKDGLVEVSPDDPVKVRLPDGRELTFAAAKQPDTRSQPFLEMLTIAQLQVPGGVPIEAEVEAEDDSHQFTADIVRGSQKIEVRVDPESRQPRVGKPESVDSDERVDGLTPDDLAGAVRKALATHPGTVTSVKIKQRDGGYVAYVFITGDVGGHSVRVYLKSGKVRGKAAEVEHEDD